jgi:hypothetical protein
MFLVSAFQFPPRRERLFNLLMPSFEIVFRQNALRFRVGFQRFPQVVFDFFEQRSRFEDLGEQAEANDLGLDLLGSGHFEGQFQRPVFELFLFLRRCPFCPLLRRTVCRSFLFVGRACGPV